MIHRTPQENKKDEIEQFIYSFLGDESFKIEIVSLKCLENYKTSKTTTEVKLRTNLESTLVKCKGEGSGVLHSLFTCLKELYAGQYRSLTGINLNSFSVTTNLCTAASFDRTDAMVEVVSEFKNAAGAITPFRASSSSLMGSAASSILSAVQFYINSEKTFLRLRDLIDDAESRNRSDLKGELVYKITKIIGVSSYEGLVR